MRSAGACGAEVPRLRSRRTVRLRRWRPREPREQLRLLRFRRRCSLSRPRRRLGLRRRLSRSRLVAGMSPHRPIGRPRCSPCGCGAAMRLAVVPTSASAAGLPTGRGTGAPGPAPAAGLSGRTATSASAGVSGCGSWSGTSALVSAVSSCDCCDGGDGDGDLRTPLGIMAGMPGGRVPSTYSGLQRLPVTHGLPSAALVRSGRCFGVAPTAWAPGTPASSLHNPAGSPLLAAVAAEWPAARLAALIGPCHGGTVGRRLRRPPRIPRRGCGVCEGERGALQSTSSRAALCAAALSSARRGHRLNRAREPWAIIFLCRLPRAGAGAVGCLASSAPRASAA